MHWNWFYIRMHNSEPTSHWTWIFRLNSPFCSKTEDKRIRMFEGFCKVKLLIKLKIWNSKYYNNSRTAPSSPFLWENTYLTITQLIPVGKTFLIIEELKFKKPRICYVNPHRYDIFISNLYHRIKFCLNPKSTSAVYFTRTYTLIHT